MNIYVVRNNHGVERLIEAPNKSQALKFATATSMVCEKASAQTVARLVSQGAEVEVVTDSHE